jgi:hypothetical protein
MEEEPDPWSGAPTPERGQGAVAAGLAGIGGGALGRLMNGISGAAGAVTPGNLIGQFQPSGEELSSDYRFS